MFTKRFFSSWQGLLAGLLATGLFFAAPPLIRLADPTAGAFDGGFLQWIALGTVAFFWGIFCVWVGWQICFPSTDKAADTGLATWFNAMPAWGKWVAVQSTFLALLAAWVAILKCVPA